jgi:hypothetical protein
MIGTAVTCRQEEGQHHMLLIKVSSTAQLHHPASCPKSVSKLSLFVCCAPCSDVSCLTAPSLYHLPVLLLCADRVSAAAVLAFVFTVIAVTTRGIQVLHAEQHSCRGNASLHLDTPRLLPFSNSCSKVGKQLLTVALL